MPIFRIKYVQDEYRVAVMKAKTAEEVEELFMAGEIIPDADRFEDAEFREVLSVEEVK